MSTFKTRKDVIQEALASVYAPDKKTAAGTQIEWLAVDIDQKWDSYVAKAAKAEEREFENSERFSMEYLLMMQIWTWYPGGGTAEIAAKRVLEAVRAIEPAS